MNFINDKYASLRKSEAKVADYIMDHSQEAVHFSVSELADAASVSEPTVIRFCRALGFKGFQDFKIYLAQSIIPATRTIHEAIEGGEDAPEMIKKVFEANIDAIKFTLNALDYAEVERVIQILIKARKIIFFGLGGSAVVAMDAHHKFFRLGVDSIWYNDSHMAMMAVSLLGKDDVLVAISHSGSTIDVVDVIETANNVGAETIAIVSHQKSPVSKVAKHTLYVSSIETEYLFEPRSSRIAQLCIIDVLSVGVSLERNEETLHNINQARKALARKRF